MPLPVVWTDAAQVDLEEITDYIAARNIPAAIRLEQLLRDAVLPLADHPLMFKESERMLGYREMVAHPNYLIFYKVLADEVSIEMVAHGRRHFPINRSPSR